MIVPTLSAHPQLTTSSLIAGLRARRAVRAEAPAPVEVPGLQPYLQAAAVLDVFDPTTLEPVSPSARDPKVLEALCQASTPAVGWREQIYRTLNDEARNAALAALGGKPAMLAALAANPTRVQTEVQATFEAWLNGALDVGRFSYRELDVLGQLYEWGLAPLGGLPERPVFEDLRRRRFAVSLFEHLVDGSFSGRGAELTRLRDFAGAAEPGAWAKVRSSFRNSGPSRPLVISGPGGVGKTALIGRFLMEHVETLEDGWFPFAYISFESDTIDVTQPWTILVHASDQLAAQVSGEAEDSLVRQALVEFRDAIATYRETVAATFARAAGFASQEARTAARRVTDEDLYDAFGQLLEYAAAAAGLRQGVRGVPVLLVLDTFENVAYRLDEHLLGLWRMLDHLQKRFPRLRVIISGRDEPRAAAMSGVKPDRLVVGDLAYDDGVLMLERLGVDDAEIRTAIVRQLGGNPLNLRLAARVARDEVVDNRGFSGLRTRRLLIARLGPELIRGQLYRRILDHMKNSDPDVRTLAHPGMALRRVTPDIIRKVLAPVCDIQKVDAARADELFKALREEHGLVRLDDGGALRYREEVRRPMLSLLVQDRPEQLQALHEQAAEYYGETGSRDPASRAEELYHRMMMGEEPQSLDFLWEPGVERFLGTAVDELPDPQKVWLAGHMSIQLPAEVYRNAEIGDWERLIGGKALELSRYGDPQQVLALLSERQERTAASPLLAIEMRALMSLGRYAEAQAICDKAALDLRARNPGRLAEVLWLGAQAARADGDTAAAIDRLGDLAPIAARLRSALPQVQALTQLLVLQAEDPGGQLRGLLNAAIKALDDGEIDTERSLMRLACVQLGPAYPDTQRRVLPLLARDLFHLVRRGPWDLGAVSAAVDLLRAQPDDRDAQLIVGLYDAADKGVEAAVAVASSLAEFLFRPDTTLFIEALLRLMRGENADLGAATLAGLDAYRESYELRASPEALA